jgi:hypothetical protein
LKMVTRTFRINPEYDRILNEESAKHGLSVSALLNQIIRQYVLITRFTENVPAITLQYRTFEPLLNRINNKDLVDEAEKAGAILPEEALLQRGERLDLESTEWFINTVYGRYGNWFESTKKILNGKERIHLSHQLNQKWSTYLGSYMTSLFISILDIYPEVETRANSVTIFLPKRSSPNRTIKRPR